MGNDDLLPGGVAKGESARWTNERHSTYISTMEASFLDQHYGPDSHRIDAKGSHLGGNDLKAIRDGMCKNIRFEGTDARMHDGVTSGLPGNLSIRRFRPRNAGVNRRSGRPVDSVDDYGSGTDTVREKVRIHGRETKGFPEQKFTEVSDQNFWEEEVNAEANDDPYKKRKPTSRVVPNDQPT